MVVDRVPIADGGEGFSETMMHALGGEWVECVASDALGKIREVKYALCGHVAVIEMAAAAGLAMLEEGGSGYLGSVHLWCGDDDASCRA